MVHSPQGWQQGSPAALQFSTSVGQSVAGPGGHEGGGRDREHGDGTKETTHELRMVRRNTCHVRRGAVGGTFPIVKNTSQKL